MLRHRLMTATAALALLGAPAALAQDPQAPAAETPPAEASQTPQTEAQTAPAPAPTAPVQAEAATGTIVDVLRTEGNFTTLLAALDAAGLTATLAGDPDITILAPTDAAFAALPEADRDRLMDPANAAELRALLLYHVINADVTPDQLQGRRGGVPTANETEVLLDGSAGALKADAATIVQADLRGSNGAVMVLDQVLDPATSMAAMGDAEAAPQEAPAAPPAGEAEAATAPDGTPTQDVETVASQPVPNPADTPPEQQPTPQNAAPVAPAGVTPPDGMAPAAAPTAPVATPETPPTTAADPDSAAAVPSATPPAPDAAPAPDTMAPAPATVAPAPAATPDAMTADPATAPPPASGESPTQTPANTTPPVDDAPDAGEEEEPDPQ